MLTFAKCSQNREDVLILIAHTHFVDVFFYNLGIKIKFKVWGGEIFCKQTLTPLDLDKFGGRLRKSLIFYYALINRLAMNYLTINMCD